MGLRFRATPFNGQVLSFVAGSPTPQQIRTEFFGLKGTSEIRGYRSSRSIEAVLCWFDNYRSRGEIETLLDQRRSSLVNTNGDLRYDDTTNKYAGRYSDVTLDAIETLSIPGSNSTTLKDYARTLFNEKGRADGGWFMFLRFTFTQLNPR